MWKWDAQQAPKAVVAIIHGAYEYHYWYMWLIEQLRANGYHVVMGDLPGHGEVKRSEHIHNESFHDYEVFVNQTLKVAMTHDLPVFVIGQGLGATLVMQEIRKKSIECAGIILLSPWLELDNTPSKLSGALASMSKIVGNMKLTHQLSLSDMTNNEDSYPELQNQPIFSTHITVSWYKELQHLMREMSNDQIKIPNIPTLVMTGGQDRITNTVASRKWVLQQHLSEFHYKEWPNCRHNLHMEEEREEIFHYMNDFMANILRSLGYIIE